MSLKYSHLRCVQHNAVGFERHLETNVKLRTQGVGLKTLEKQLCTAHSIIIIIIIIQTTTLQAHSQNYCCPRKNEYRIFLCLSSRVGAFACAFVRVCAFARASAHLAFLIQHVKCMRHTVICGLSGSTTFFDTVSQIAQFSGEVTECVLIFSTIFV